MRLANSQPRAKHLPIIAIEGDAGKICEAPSTFSHKHINKIIHTYTNSELIDSECLLLDFGSFFAP